MKTITFVKKMMMAAATILAVFASLLPGTAHAIPSALYYMVSPASCQPESSTDAAKLTLSNGVWTYKSNQYGLTTLVCPINFSGNTSSKVTAVSLSYRDDWVGANLPQNDPDNGSVTATLKMRDRTAPGATNISDANTDSTWSENAALTESIAYSYDFEPVQQQSAIPSLGKIYFVEVKMSRPQTNSDLQVGFTGYEIRF